MEQTETVSVMGEGWQAGEGLQTEGLAVEHVFITVPLQ